MKFFQIIETQSSKIDELLELDKQWESATQGRNTATSATVLQDRDRPNTYLWIIEFPSYEDAMRNNDLPETHAIAEKMAALSDGSPAFRNLDVVEQRTL
jgi:quinol monooxygenase YgiN